jgi:hypothetical protein
MIKVRAMLELSILDPPIIARIKVTDSIRNFMSTYFLLQETLGKLQGQLDITSTCSQRTIRWQRDYVKCKWLYSKRVMMNQLNV